MHSNSYLLIPLIGYKKGIFHIGSRQSILYSPRHSPSDISGFERNLEHALDCVSCGVLGCFFESRELFMWDVRWQGREEGNGNDAGEGRGVMMCRY